MNWGARLADVLVVKARYAILTGLKLGQSVTCIYTQ